MIDRDDDLLDIGQLVSEGMDPADAVRVLGPQSARPRHEIDAAIEMLDLERRDAR